MKIELIAIDVDGTLLNDQYQITPRTKEAIAEVKKRGSKVVLASGRAPKSCYPLMEELELDEPIITNNGAVIIDPRTHELSLEIGYKAHELKEIIQYCRDHSIHFDLNTALQMYIEGVTPEAKAMYDKFYITPMFVKDSSLVEDQIVKFTMFGLAAQLDRAHQELTPLFPSWSIIRSGETFIDIIHPRATKGHALHALLEDYNIQAEHVMAIGNYYNDLEMLQLAGIGVAMENSPDEVKRLADRVTASNNQDGVALVLEEILKN